MRKVNGVKVNDEKINYEGTAPVIRDRYQPARNWPRDIKVKLGMKVRETGEAARNCET